MKTKPKVHKEYKCSECKAEYNTPEELVLHDCTKHLAHKECNRKMSTKYMIEFQKENFPKAKPIILETYPYFNAINTK